MVVVEEVPWRLDAKPSDIFLLNSILKFVCDVQESGTLRTHLPLLRPGSHRVDLHVPDIDVDGPDCLDPVNDEVYAPFPAEPTDGCHVGPIAGKKLHRAESNDAGPGSQSHFDLFDGEATVAALDDVDLDAKAFEGDVGIDVRRKFEIIQQNPIAGFPIETRDNDVQCVRCVAGEGDTLMRLGMDELLNQDLRLLDLREIGKPRLDLSRRPVLQMACHRIQHASRHRARCCVIQINDPF